MTRFEIIYDSGNFEFKRDKKGVKEGSLISKNISIGGKNFNKRSLINSINNQLSTGDKKLKKGWFFGYGGTKDSEVRRAAMKTFQKLQKPTSDDNTKSSYSQKFFYGPWAPAKGIPDIVLPNIDIDLVNKGEILLYDIPEMRSSRELLYFIESKKSELKHLNLDQLQISDADLERIVNMCPHLSSLKLSARQKLTPQSFDIISKLTHLFSLDLSCGAVTDEGLKEITKNLSYLRVLNLNNCKNITDEGLKDVIKNLVLLTSLNLSWCPISNEGLKNISKNLIHLTHLELACCHIQNMDEIAKLNGLIFLGLSDNDISDDELKKLVVLNKLTVLDLSNAIITDSSLEILTHLNELTYLDLSGCNITDAGLKIVAGLKNLTTLNLSNCKKITDDGVIKIASNLTFLESINLNNTENYRYKSAGDGEPFASA